MNLKTLDATPSEEWPAEAGALLLSFLTSRKATEEDRLLATRLSGDATVVDDELAGALLAILSDGTETEDLRSMAALALGPALEAADLGAVDGEDDSPISEETFGAIKERMRKLYVDATVPDETRRRILEASVRAPQAWHPDAVRAAHASQNEKWRLSAIFSMRYVSGFDDLILAALEDENEDMVYEAIGAAGDSELDAAWLRVSGLATSRKAPQALRLAAIDAVPFIRPDEAVDLLSELLDERDKEIVEAAGEALAIAEGLSGGFDFDEDLDDDLDEEWDDEDDETEEEDEET